MVALDPVGNVGLALQVVILFLLILGLPFVKGKDGKNNAARHGYLTLVALVLHTILIFVIMVPSFSENLGEIGGLSILSSVTVWSHAVLGTLAEVLGIVIVASWLLHSPSRMTCYRMKAWMAPVFIVWAVSLINGALIHILGML